MWQIKQDQSSSSRALGKFCGPIYDSKNCRRLVRPVAASPGQSPSPSFTDIHDASDGAICSLSVPTAVHPPVMKIYGYVWRPWRLIIISRRTSGPSACPLLVSLNYLSSIVGPARTVNNLCACCSGCASAVGGRLTPTATSIKRSATHSTPALSLCSHR